MKTINLTVCFTAEVPDDVDIDLLCIHLPNDDWEVQTGKGEVEGFEKVQFETVAVELVED